MQNVLFYYRNFFKNCIIILHVAYTTLTVSDSNKLESQFHFITESKLIYLLFFL